MAEARVDGLCIAEASCVIEETVYSEALRVLLREGEACMSLN